MKMRVIIYVNKIQTLKDFFGQHLKQTFLLYLSKCFSNLSSCTERNTSVYTENGAWGIVVVKALSY
jgi:hypothetical protein